MEFCEEDGVTGINYSCFNVIAFNFFPFSTLGWIQVTGNRLTHSFWERQTLSVGSVAENLDLPILMRKSTAEEQHFTDADFMIPLCFLSDIHDVILISTSTADVSSPLHCKVSANTVSSDNKVTFVTYINGKQMVNAHVEREPWKPISTVEGVNYKVVVDKYGAYFVRVPCLSEQCPERIIQSLQKRFDKADHCSLPMLKDVPERLYTEGIHVVHKPHKDSVDPDYTFRFSFSVIEKELAQSLNSTQRAAYRVLKGLIKSELNVKVPSDNLKLPSYLLKTNLFWVCEKLPIGFCRSQSLGKLFFLLLDKLLHSISDGSISHFFIPEGNLLDQYEAETLGYWIKGLSRIRNNTIDAIMDFWNTYDFYTIHEVTRFLMKIGIYCFEKSELPELKMKNQPNFQKIVNHMVSSILSMQAQCLNITDILRLLLEFFTIFCSCDSRVMKDLDEVCWKCMISEFCKLTETYSNIFFPYLLSETANMWYIRALHDEENKDFYRNKADVMFKQALKGPVSHHTNFNYALYLMAQQKYEEAVASILKALITNELPYDIEEFIIPGFLNDILDPVLQTLLSGRSFIRSSYKRLLYHLLYCCYIRCGVYTEMILTPYINLRKTAMVEDKFVVSDSLLEDGLGQLGDQFILKGDYLQALEFFTVGMMKTKDINLGVVVCIANLVYKKCYPLSG